MGKLFWNIQAKADKLWVKWISTYYLKKTSAMDWQSRNCSWLIANIFKCKYNTAATYRDIRGDRGHVEWWPVFNRNLAKPRAKFTLWLGMLDRLATKDKLVKFGIVLDPKCAFCNDDETLQHVLFDCKWTGTVWQQVMQQIGYRRQALGWQQEKSWIAAECKRKG